MGNRSGEKLFWWCVAIFIIAAISTGGTHAKGHSGGGGNKPKTHQVCNQYFKGGC